MAAALVKALDIPEDKMFALFRIGRARIDSSRSVPHLIEEPGNRRVAARFVLAKKNRCQFFEFVHFLDLTARLQSLAPPLVADEVVASSHGTSRLARVSVSRRIDAPGRQTTAVFQQRACSC